MRQLGERAKPIIGIHIDLKGVRFKPAYIPELLADLAGQGINTVLVEYEDCFPFQGLDIAWDRKATWSPAILARFLGEAQKNGIEVIPLQQCLGHLEYLMGWDRYRRFAEKPAYPSTLCLSNPDGKKLVREMLRQILTAHPASRFVHLGMDEARGLASCPKCRRKGDLLKVFLGYLRELCDVVEEFGKTPMIWTDMLEDHFRPEVFKGLQDRVIFVPWDYGATSERITTGRIAGFRVSREWLKEPANPAAPAIGPGATFTEDIPPAIRKVIRPYRHGRYFTALFQADLWSKLGFRVIGASAVRFSWHGAVLPRYNQLRGNLRTWASAIRRTGQMGQIGTSWARGTSWCPPNFSMDLTWPNVSYMARQMGARPRPFRPGIPAATVERIVTQLGRCREDWRLEVPLADEMDRLAPRLRAHRYEWESLALMARVLYWHRRSEDAQAEVNFFDANIHPIADEWQRRLDDQSAVLKALAALRRQVRVHFGRRYFGGAFEEWIRELFDLHIRRLKACGLVCRAKLKKSRRFHARS